MAGRFTLYLALIALANVAGCQRAGRYPAAVSLRSKGEPPAEKLLPHWSWHLQEGWREPRGTAMVFIAQGQADWDRLQDGWTTSSPAAELGAAQLLPSPLGAAATAVLARHLHETSKVVKIKVPLGLPDPTPLLPQANPPTVEKWELGRRIFFTKKLQAGADYFSCASCHDPAQGFADGRGAPINGVVNTASLINCIYNRHQFGDGRAAALEEVVVRSLEDERTAKQKKPEHYPQETHRWGGLVEALGKDADFQLSFQKVFGLAKPTQDVIAKALATYMRTIISGNSIVDRADQERRRGKSKELLAEHFTSFLDEKTILALRTEKDTRDGLAKKLEQGHKVFHDKGCAACHSGPLYTDHDFHNLGVGDSARMRQPGEETGRFAVVPIGLKQARLVGAVKTPTLRALPRTAPYFHDGRAHDLRYVVKYFNFGIDGYRFYLPPQLVDADGRGKRLDLSFEDEAALVVFLRALDGDAVDAKVTAAPK